MQSCGIFCRQSCRVALGDVFAVDAGPVLIFDDATGRSIDVDTRGSDEEIAARLGASALGGSSRRDVSEPPASRGRGRPKLGVVPREVTLFRIFPRRR